MTMSVLTNSVFSSCDLWQQFNRLVAYNIRLDANILEVHKAHLEIMNIWKDYFLPVKKLDLIKMLKLY